MPGGAKGRIEIVNRKQAAIEGVKNVNSSDEDKIVLETNLGVLILKGAGMQITQLDLESGQLSVDGYLHSLEYVEAPKSAKHKGKIFLTRVLR